jgi:hypothetical protein
MASVLNGFSPKIIISERKNAVTPASTAVAQGTMSRIRRRVTNRTTLEYTESSSAQSSSEPSWLDHIAVSL